MNARNLPDGAIKIYYYYDLTDTSYFCSKLEQRFRETGHNRPLEFINWNCYKQEPGRDGDIYIYDAIVMTALVNKGYLHELPDIIDISDMFGWTIEKSKVKKKTYGVPLMVCANALITRRKDDHNIRNIFDLHERTAIPLKSMMMYYYLQAFCNYQNDSVNEVFEHLLELMGRKEALDGSSLDEYDGIRRFNAGECNYFLGFTESLRLLEPGDYVVKFANFSDYSEDQMPLFQVDYASLSHHVKEEKMLDCLDLLEIMTDKEFIYGLCMQEGRLTYMLPPSMSVYGRLAEADPIYKQLYEMLLSEENGVFRYGETFYEEFYNKSDVLLQSLAKSDYREFFRWNETS